MLSVGLFALYQGTVIFSAPAAPVGRLLPDLAKAMGLRLEASTALAREVLMVNVHDVPASDLMARIADVTNGEWEEKEGVYRLTLSASKDAKAQREAAKARGESMLQPYRLILSKSVSIQGQPSTIQQILAKFPPETLGGLRFKERAVFSTRPTAMQRPMPSGVLNGIDFTRLGPPTGLEEGYTHGPVVGAYLALQDSGDGRSLSAALVAFDSEGRATGGQASYLGFQKVIMADGKIKGDAPTTALPVPDAKIVFPPEEQSRAEAFVRSAPSSEPFRLAVDEQAVSRLTTYSPEDLAARPTLPAGTQMLQPERDEPLAQFAGPLFTRLAKGQGGQLIALIPDSAFVPATRLAAKGTVLANEAVREAWMTMETSVVQENGWTVVRPRFPTSARTNRLDRGALGTALRALAKTGTLTLNDRAAYAAAQPYLTSTDSLEGALFSIVDPQMGKRIAASSESGERHSLRLYRALSPTLPEQFVPFSRLSAAAKAILTEIVFNSVSEPIVPVQVNRGGAIHTIIRGTGGIPASVSEERTVYWGRGIPSEAQFRAVDFQRDGLYGLAPSGAHPRLDENSSSMSIRTGSNGLTVVSTSLPRLEKYQQGRMRRIELVLQVGEGAAFRRTLEEDSIYPNAPVVLYENLPDIIKARIEQAEEQMRKSVEQSQRRSGSVRP